MVGKEKMERKLRDQRRIISRVIRHRRNDDDGDTAAQACSMRSFPGRTARHQVA